MNNAFNKVGKKALRREEQKPGGCASAIVTVLFISLTNVRHFYPHIPNVNNNDTIIVSRWLQTIGYLSKVESVTGGPADIPIRGNRGLTDGSE